MYFQSTYLISYLVLLHLAFAAVVVKSDTLPRLQGLLGIPTTAHPEFTDHHQNMRRYHTHVDGNVPDGAVLFFGDSITQGLATAAITPNGVNFGIAGDSSFSLLDRLPKYASVHRAGVIVIAVGNNDMNLRENPATVANLHAVLAQVPEPIPVILNAVLPVDEPEREFTGGWNSKIADLNDHLAAVAAESPRVHFVPPNPAYFDDENNLADPLHNGDGIHLSPAGYAIWIADLRVALAPLTAD
ncbi:MAG: SGNH/GDSL hydrolase family protein [Thiotrichales bacterium]